MNMRQRNLFFISSIAFLIIFFSSFDDAKSEDSLVSIPLGVSVPGCEETNQCYIPFQINVHVGDKVTWRIDDTAAHTVTSGDLSVDPDNVATQFDSGLFLAGDSFSHTFIEEGIFEYFCMVHPWMTGIVNVQAALQNGNYGGTSPLPVLNTITLNIANSLIRGEDLLHISGKVNPVDTSEDEVRIYVFTENQKSQITRTGGLVKPDGSFELDLEAGGNIWNANEGTLKVVARYSDYPGATKEIIYENVDEPIKVLLITSTVIGIGAVIVTIVVLKKRKRTLTQTLKDSKLK